MSGKKYRIPFAAAGEIEVFAVDRAAAADAVMRRISRIGSGRVISATLGDSATADKLMDVIARHVVGVNQVVNAAGKNGGEEKNMRCSDD